MMACRPSPNGSKTKRSAWKDDDTLREALKKYTRQGLQRTEILSFVERDFAQYSWSMRTLYRRLKYFGLYRTDPNVDIHQLRAAVKKEIDGPGRLLGYRAMQNAIRQKHNLNVPRGAVHAMMYELDPEGLERRAPGPKPKRLKGNFSTKGPNWVYSLDGHAKLMGYQKSTFPLAIYGCIDTASRKIMFLKIWTSDSDPKIVGRWYFDFLYENKYMSSCIRIDKGTETGELATMHAFLRSHHGDMDPTDTVIYGPSTANQIERWWKELHERLEKYFKDHLQWLKNEMHYDPHNDEDRSLLAYIFIPILEKELKHFKDVIWNTHRIRAQKDVILPCGIPDHIYNFPEEYGLADCRKIITEDQLREVALCSNALEVNEDYLEVEFRERCKSVIPDPYDIEPADCVNAYLYLKDNLPPNNSA